MLRTLLNLQLSAARLLDLTASLHTVSLVIVLFQSNTTEADADFVRYCPCFIVVDPTNCVSHLQCMLQFMYYIQFRSPISQRARGTAPFLVFRKSV